MALRSALRPLVRQQQQVARTFRVTHLHQQRTLATRALGGEGGSSRGQWTTWGAASSSLVATAWVASILASENDMVEAAEASQAPTAGDVKPGIKEYTRKEVASHTTPSTGIWVTYRNGVYDITKFLEIHPGGNKILLGAGGAIDKYWAMYGVHKTEDTFALLEEYRIGNVHVSDRWSEKELAKLNDIWGLEPKRSDKLHVHTAKPCNAEAPSESLANDFITPNELFFVRNHLPVPVVDVNVFELEINGVGVPGDEPVRLTVEDLKKKFEPHTVMATMQCTGNRRHAMGVKKKLRGTSWSNNAISNASWTGARLRDVLLYSGVKEEDCDQVIKHIGFEGLDRDTSGPYGVSIPVTKAMRVDGEVIIAYKMNGVDIPPDHGAPLRAVVPGVTGARNVKWLHKVICMDEEYDGYFQQTDYRIYPAWQETLDGANKTFAPSVQDTPVQSAIMLPNDEEAIPSSAKEFTVKGYAFSGGGRGIVRVDVSSDGGKTWNHAELRRPDQKSGQVYAWTQFSLNVPLTEEMRSNKEVELVCRAFDESYNTQPEVADWNIRGLLNNSWHRIRVKIQ